MPKSQRKNTQSGRVVKEITIEVEEVFSDVRVINDNEPEPPPGGRYPPSKVS